MRRSRAQRKAAHSKKVRVTGYGRKRGAPTGMNNQDTLVLELLKGFDWSTASEMVVEFNKREQSWKRKITFAQMLISLERLLALAVIQHLPIRIQGQTRWRVL